jgi:hypothetical protein
MNVEKKSMIHIPITIFDYYNIKEKFMGNKTCPECKKKSENQLVFSIKNRVLSCKCITPQCLNVHIYVDSFITYDKKYHDIKTNFDSCTDSILREKFDIMFNYKKPVDISELKQKFLWAKDEYIQEYHDRDKIVQPDYTLRDEYIETLKQRGVVSNEELNVVLNKIHSQLYTTVYDEVIRTPEYPLEIHVL